MQMAAKQHKQRRVGGEPPRQLCRLTHLDCGGPLKDGGAASRTVNPRRKRGRRSASGTGANRDGCPHERSVERESVVRVAAAGDRIGGAQFWCWKCYRRVVVALLADGQRRNGVFHIGGPEQTHGDTQHTDDSMESLSVCEQEPDSPGAHAHTNSKQTHTTRPHGGGDTHKRKQAHTLLKGVAPKRKWALACVTCDVSINLEMLMVCSRGRVYGANVVWLC